MSAKEKNRNIFFEKIAALLTEHNWSPDILTMAEKSGGLEKNYHKLLFPGGLNEIVPEFESWLDEKMLAELEKIEKPKKIREQIALALKIRLMDVISREASIKNSSFFLLPNHTLSGMESACRTCDLIWRYAGDQSSDFNYYTKRGLLLPVYLSAKTFYFADNSAYYQKTQEFIKNALDNIINIASFKQHIKTPKIEDIPILRLFS